MRNWLVMAITAMVLVIGGLSAAVAADKAEGAKNAEEDDTVYTKVAAACQKQITEDKVPNAADRQEQISVCIEKGIENSEN